MNPSPNWRDRFVDLAAELCRARGEAPPNHEPGTGHCLRLQLCIDGVAFDALHFDTDDDSADRILVQCRFGTVPDALHDQALELALQMNVGLGRTHAGVFGYDEDSQELIFCTLQSLREVRHQDLLRGLGQIAALALQWQQNHRAPAR